MLRELIRWSGALLAFFGLGNSLRTLFGGTNHNLWWIDLRFLPSALAAGVVALCCSLILAGALAPHRRGARIGAATSSALLATAACANAATFWWLMVNGHIRSEHPIPLSIVVSGLLTAAAWANCRPPTVPAARRALTFAPALALALAFPLFQSFTFGMTSYARPVDAIVVFGARVYADGTPSDALSDRVREGVQLYHAGLAPRLVMSGGPGDGQVSEPEAMQRLAESLGVPPSAITQDPQGLNSAATLRTCSQLGLSRVLAVSHFYHLPRIKLLADGAGVQAYTVPSPQGRPLRALPRFMAREVAAWWWYYVAA